jgi:hypothetical protein
VSGGLLALVLAAAVPHLLLAGAGAVRLAVQLPARHRLGPIAFASYCRAADLGPGGRTLYPLLGIGGPLAAWAALVVAYAGDSPAPVRVSLAVAGGLAVLHSFTTARAAPAMLRIGRAADRPEVLAPLIETFTRWSWPRTILQAMTAVALMCALVLGQGRGPLSVAVLTTALVAFTLVTVLAGAALDQVVVHLPVRQRIGTAAYADYLRAADLRNGRVLYPVVGLSSNAALITTLVLAVLQPAPAGYAVAFAVAVGCGAAAFVATAQAVPAARQLVARARSHEDAAVDRFIRAARIRAPLFMVIFASLLWALAGR